MTQSRMTQIMNLYRTPKQVETGKEAETVESLTCNELILRESLGGALKWYERKAA